MGTIDYIICEDGIVVKNANSERFYWSWEYEQMDRYGKENPSKVAKHLLGDIYHNMVDLEFRIKVKYYDGKMHDIL